MEVKGKIKVIGETQTFDSGFQKRQVVIHTETVETANGSFDKHLAIDMIKDKCSLLDQFNVGDEVDVSYNLESKEHNGRWFTNATGWKIYKTNQEGATAQAESIGEEDKLPF